MHKGAVRFSGSAHTTGKHDSVQWVESDRKGLAMKRIGEYEIKKQLREEDLGQLYLAAKDDEDFDLLIVSEAVLKSRSARKRFLERMRKLTDQPRFSSWRRVFEEDGRVVLLHAPQAHPSLEDEIQQKSALDWRKALELGSKIANILANAHGLEPSLSHGDLRPEHVELLPAGEVRLRHFGAAQIADEVTEDRARSLRRLRYLSPEQLDYDEATPRSDIYSLALIIFEMISGEPVFTQATEQDIESAKLKAVDLSLPATLQHKVPERLEPLLESMLAVDPAARPARIADIGKEFDAMLAKSPGGSAMENDVVQRYLSRLDAEKARRNAMLTQDDRRGIALDLGMSREELLAAEEAAEAYWTRGEGYLEHQLWDDAIEQLTNAFELSPERVEILFSLARAHHGRWQAKGAKKDAIEAQRIARRCIDIDPRHPEAFKLLAELDKAMAEAKASEPDHEPKPVPVSRRSAMSKQKPGLMQLSLIGLLTALLGLVFWFAVDPLGAWHLAPPTNPPAQPQTQDPPHTPPVVPPHTPPTPPVTPDTPVVPPHAQSAARLDTADQTAMLLVAEGKATFGSPSGEGEADEQPERIRELPDFYMDETEITVASYQRCVNDGFCANAFFTSWSSDLARQHCNYGALGREQHPMNCISPKGAENFCAWRAAQDSRYRFRLPTEDEWEKAARGTDGRRYIWGNEPEGIGGCRAHTKRCGANSTAAVKSVVLDQSPYAIFDLAGNVSEWVIVEQGASDLAPGGKHSFTTRGSNWTRDGALRVADRDATPVPLGDTGENAADVGFRCVANAR